MVKTGISGLDDLLGGEIPKGKSLVNYIQPGVEGEIFGERTIYTNLINGRNSVIISSSTSPENTRKHFKEFGWDVELFKEKLTFVDAYNPLIGARSDEIFTVSNPDNIESLNEIITTLLVQSPPSTILFSSLSTIMDFCGEKETIEAVRSWNKIAMLYDHVIIYNFTAWPYSDETLGLIKKDLFDAVISIGGIQKQLIFGQYFKIMKASWTETVNRSIMFKISRPGGVKLFIPKIIVTSPFNTGKSTFIHSLSDRSISVDRLGTTIALDHGHVDYKGFSADIFGTPGHERFDPIIKLISGEAMGVFLVIDSTNPDDFVQAKKILDTTKSYCLPYIIIANKQDLAGALKPEEINRHLNLPENVPVMPVGALDNTGVYEAFEVLINKITGEI